MKTPDFFIVKKKRSPWKNVLKIVSVALLALAAVAVVYKVFLSKVKSTILGEVDIDGDGEADAIMLDTTGNGEVDTIIINAELDEEDEEE